MDFARTHCDIPASRARDLLGEVAEGVLSAVDEVLLYMRDNEAFREVGVTILQEWNKGLNLSVQPEGVLKHFAIPDFTALGKEKDDAHTEEAILAP